MVFLGYKGHRHEALSVSSIANMYKIVNLSVRQTILRDYFIILMISNMQSCHAMIHSQHILLGF